MAWLVHQGVVCTVQELLDKIAAASLECAAVLAEVDGHQVRCEANTAADGTHEQAAPGVHGADNTLVRTRACNNLVNALASLRRALAELHICSTEMSHGGMP